MIAGGLHSSFSDRKIWMKACLTLLITVVSFLPAHANDLIMVRSKQAFPETMTNLQHAILNHGYHITKVQRVDIGLTASGFKTDKYRLVFLGNKYMLEQLPDKYPELIPYVPLKIAIFAEEDQTLMLAMNMENLGQYYPGKPEINKAFRQWTKDLLSILYKARLEDN